MRIGGLTDTSEISDIIPCLLCSTRTRQCGNWLIYGFHNVVVVALFDSSRYGKKVRTQRNRVNQKTNKYRKRTKQSVPRREKHPRCEQLFNWCTHSATRTIRNCFEPFASKCPRFRIAVLLALCRMKGLLNFLSQVRGKKNTLTMNNSLVHPHFVIAFVLPIFPVGFLASQRRNGTFIQLGWVKLLALIFAVLCLNHLQTLACSFITSGSALQLEPAEARWPRA